EWCSHIRELRARIDWLIAERKLIFRGKGQDGGLGPIGREDIEYYQILLSSYIHMMNNRLGVSISDEIYLSYLMKRVMEDRVAAVAGGAG
ncbi:MAG: lantibiotic biosynthesis protein, partial [Actinobacteria bacterium HGW-Actinobacteria-8]